jgi:hypothetical protein
MATKYSVELAVLRFEGKRFEGHTVDVECTHELIAYRTLVLECAKELWRRKNPGRVRLPNRFEGGFRVEFDRVTEGSAAIPLRRVREDVQGELLEDEFDEAAALIDSAISAADSDELLPDDLPANVVPLFSDFGRSLRTDEAIFTKARRNSSEAPYTAKARSRLAEWTPPTYDDRVDLVGEVRMANLGPGTFSLQSPQSEVLVTGRFDERQEALVLDALKNHRSVRLRVRGIGEFGTHDRQIRNLISVEDVSVAPVDADKYDETAPPIWEQLAEIGKKAPTGTWDAVPEDLSTRIDEIVYGEAKGSQ